MPCRRLRAWAVSAAAALGACQPVAQDQGPGGPLARLRLPDGFAIETWAHVPGARSLSVADDGAAVYVGTRGSSIFVVRDPERDGVADEVALFVDGLKVPNGLAVDADGALFVVERHRVIRISRSGEVETVVPAGVLPDQPRHDARYAGVGPNGRLYVAVGAPCNVCPVKGFEGTILRMEPSSHGLRIFARGVRNSVGFDWHPATGEMFFTDNGGDGLGDLIPPDELNHAPESNRHFGYPYVYGASIPYPQFADYVPPSAVQDAALEFESHVEALGIEFYEGTMYPSAYRHDAFVAQHGSRDRLPGKGYRVVRVRFEDGRPVGKEVFVDGWLGPDGAITGRPVDLEELPDGSLLLSDDEAGVIYRITYAEPSR